MLNIGSKKSIRTILVLSIMFLLVISSSVFTFAASSKSDEAPNGAVMIKKGGDNKFTGKDTSKDYIDLSKSAEEAAKAKAEQDAKAKAKAEKAAAVKTGEKVVEFAKKYVGNPYVLGGTDVENGIDCSNFVRYVFNNAGGKEWNKSGSVRMLQNEIRDSAKEVSVDDMQPGDLVFFNGHEHVAIYCGDNVIVHAKDESSGIVVQDMVKERGRVIRLENITEVLRVV